MLCRDLSVLVLNVAILVCAGISICGMYGTDIVWSRVSANSTVFSGDVNFGLIKFQTQIMENQPLQWMSYQDCSEHQGLSLLPDLKNMCVDCNSFGKLALGFAGSVLVLGLLSVCQLVCGCGRPAVTLVFAGFAALFSVCAWSVCYVRLIYLFDRTQVDGQYQYNYVDVPTVEAGACAMSVAMLLSWLACCCAPRQHIEVIHQVYHEQPLIQAPVMCAEPQTEYHRQYRQEVTASPAYDDLPPQKLRCWQQFADSEGQTYYYNPATQQTQWQPPNE